MNTPTPREVFEKWITTDLNYSVATYRNSEEYLSDAVQVAWIAWQEASKELTAAREEIEELNDKLDDAVAESTNAVNDIIRMKWQRDRLAEALKLFLNRVQYTSAFMDGELRGGTFDYRSSGFDAEVKQAYQAIETTAN